MLFPEQFSYRAEQSFSTLFLFQILHRFNGLFQGDTNLWQEFLQHSVRFRHLIRGGAVKLFYIFQSPVPARLLSIHFFEQTHRTEFPVEISQIFFYLVQILLLQFGLESFFKFLFLFKPCFLYVVLVVLELSLSTRLASDSQRSTFLFLLSAGIKGMCHHNLANRNFL